jgi:hypothetical protein
MYSVKADLAKQKADLAGFIRRSTGQKAPFLSEIPVRRRQ